jgi:hypothetical protein
MTQILPELIKAIDGVVATTTSQVIYCKGAKKITFMFKRADHSAGKTIFTVATSIDDSNFVTSGILVDNIANATANNPVRVASYDTGTANATKLYALDMDYFGLTSFKVTATETTDGTHYAYALIEY